MTVSLRTILATMGFAIAPSIQTSIPVSTVESYSTIYSDVTPTASSGTTQVGCPTITLTSSICSTCATPDCIQIEAVTQSCGCPSAIPTVFVDFPCGSDASACAGIGCAANYVFFSASCVASASTTGSSGASNSTRTVTSTTSGAGGANSTATTAANGTVTASTTSTLRTSASDSGTSLASTASVAMAGKISPFWMGWM